MATIHATRGPRPAPAAMPPGAGDDERSLLAHLEQLLDREEASLVARDAAVLVAIAEERERVSERLGQAARARRATTGRDADSDAELVASYRRLRDRHAVQAKVIRHHLEHNARAIGVIAQASGPSNLYQANGRLPLRFAAGAST